MTGQRQAYTSPPRKMVLVWLLGVYAAVAVACVVLTAIPLALFGGPSFRAVLDQRATATARALQGGDIQSPSGVQIGGVQLPSGPPRAQAASLMSPTPDLRPTTSSIALALPGSATAPVFSPSPSPVPGALAAEWAAFDKHAAINDNWGTLDQGSIRLTRQGNQVGAEFAYTAGSRNDAGMRFLFMGTDEGGQIAGTWKSYKPGNTSSDKPDKKGHFVVREDGKGALAGEWTNDAGGRTFWILSEGAQTIGATSEAGLEGDSAATPEVNNGSAAVMEPPAALPTASPGGAPDLSASTATVASLVATRPPGPISGDSIHVTASGFAPPGFNKCNQQTTFEPGNAIDGDLGTAWRVEGDGASTGAYLMLDWATDVTITDVQIVPGYAKKDPCAGVEWFPLNRRVKKVRLDFSDGSTASGGLGDAASYQSVSFSPVRAKWVKITILETYPAPPQSQGGRDYTPISEVKVIGAP